MKDILLSYEWPRDEPDPETPLELVAPLNEDLLFALARQAGPLNIYTGDYLIVLMPDNLDKGTLSEMIEGYPHLATIEMVSKRKLEIVDTSSAATTYTIIRSD